MLLDPVEISFSRAQMTAKFLFVAKLFTIIKDHKHRLTQDAVASILNLPKVRRYVLWQKAQPQLGAIVNAACLHAYSRVQRRTLSVSLRAEANQEGVSESEQQLLKGLKGFAGGLQRHFLDGVHSTGVQKIFEGEA